MKDGKTVTLAIESSCDETAAAVMSEGRGVLSNIISSQIDIHKQYGGVVPEIASRHHLTNINTVVDRAMEEADVSIDMYLLFFHSSGMTSITNMDAATPIPLWMYC